MGNDGPSESSPPDDSWTKVPLDVIPLHSTNLLTVLDENGTILYESPAIERIFGFDQDDLVGTRVAQCFHPDDRDDVLEAFETVVESPQYTVESVEYRHERADGSYLWVESAASANPTPEGHYVVNTRDISDRKARERELESSNSRLDEFASVVSHDLRNPLNVAMGRLQLAQETGDLEHLDTVAQAHERMETLIDDLLTLAQTGTTVRELESVDLASLSRECWETVSTGRASLRVDIDHPIRADRSRLRQLLENLIRNAVDHGGEQVTVTVGEQASPMGFYVADDGPGVGEDERDQVFETGFSTREDGTGLGLTIVSEIAEAHGWQIGVTESRAGGARFDVTGVDR